MISEQTHNELKAEIAALKWSNRRFFSAGFSLGYGGADIYALDAHFTAVEEQLLTPTTPKGTSNE